MQSRFALRLAPWLLLLSLAGCEDGGQMTVTGIDPKAGHIAGDQNVQILGKNFRSEIGYSVYFGNAKASSVTIRGTDALVVRTPEHEAGVVDVTVRADDGNAFKLKQAYTYEDMGGSVVEGLGESAGKKSGNLQF